jgi:hypothetical protein
VLRAAPLTLVPSLRRARAPQRRGAPRARRAAGAARMDTAARVVPTLRECCLRVVRAHLDALGARVAGARAQPRARSRRS